jgi:peptide/nickel transport system substrate-binding protein
VKALSHRFAVVSMVGVASLGVLGAASQAAGAAHQARASSNAAASTLTISAADGETWPCSFNPFNPNTYFFSLGMVNEELYYINSLTGKMTPWLASGYRFSDGAKVLTWTIRKNVRFSNGQLMTAADVAFTFQLIKKNPSLDLNSIDPTLVSVEQTGSDQVTMRFSQPAAQLFYYVADQVGIVPKSVWQNVKNPLTWPDAHPIGTGPYTIGACTPQNVEYLKNPNFWQPGLPKFDKVELPAIITNDVSNEELANGQAQWGGQFIPNIKAYYLDKNPNYRTWSPVGGYHGIFINLTNPILSKLPVRQAMAYAIDRNRVTDLADTGEMPGANQSGVILPMEQAWYNAKLAAKYDDYAYNPAKAISVLEKAGYKRGSGGIFETPSGQPLSFNIIVVGGYSNEVAAIGVITSELAAVGIQLHQMDLSTPTFSSDMADGKFELGYSGAPGITIDGPYGMMRGLLYSGNTAPIGQPAASNYERFRSSQEDALFARLAATTNIAAAESLMKRIEAPMLTDVPFIPVDESGDWNEYNVGFASGWPTASNPYANPSPTTQPDEEVVLLHLVPKA